MRSNIGAQNPLSYGGNYQEISARDARTNNEIRSESSNRESFTGAQIKSESYPKKFQDQSRTSSVSLSKEMSAQQSKGYGQSYVEADGKSTIEFSSEEKQRQIQMASGVHTATNSFEKSESSNRLESVSSNVGIQHEQNYERNQQKISTDTRSRSQTVSSMENTSTQSSGSTCKLCPLCGNAGMFNIEQRFIQAN